MNSINKIITTEYMKDRSDVAVVYEDGSFSHYLIKGEKKTLFDMVTMAKEYIYENNLSTAEKLIPIWKPLIYQSGDDNLISYYQSVQFELSYWRISSLNNEFSYQKLFKDNVEKLFPEYKLIDIKNDPKHIPDVWVEESGLMIPVEVKLRSFDNAALKQLKRYMNHYKTNKGIAVARNLTANLPHNIRFISFEELGDD